MKQEEKDARLQEILLKLAKPQLLSGTDLMPYQEELVKIYKSGFRHQDYALSDIAKTVLSVQNDLDIETFLYNLTELKNAIDKSDGERAFRRGFTNLYKALKFELTRWQDFGELQNKLRRMEQLYSQFKVQTDELRRENNQLQERADNLERQLTSQSTKIYTDLITILGILVSIVMVFTGGKDYLSGVLALAKGGSFQELIFITIACGLVLADIIATFMYFLTKLTGRATKKESLNILIINVLLLIIFGIAVQGYMKFIANLY